MHIEEVRVEVAGGALLSRLLHQHPPKNWKKCEINGIKGKCWKYQLPGQVPTSVFLWKEDDTIKMIECTIGMENVDLEKPRNKCFETFTLLLKNCIVKSSA